MTVMLSYFTSWVQLVNILHTQQRIRRRRILTQIFKSTSNGQEGILRQLAGIQKDKIARRKRRFWTRPGRTSAWWQSFENQIVVPEEWHENFRMSRHSFLLLCDELRPFLTKQTTNMRVPLSVEKQVAVTLYYLSDEGRYRKVANSFGISRATVSKVVRRTCFT